MGAEAIALDELRTYFDRNYSRAVSLTQTGVSVGIMIIPPVTQFSIDVYGWRGTMLLLGALNMHIVLSGVLLKPIIGDVLARKQQRTSTKTSCQLSHEQDAYAKSVLRSALHKIAYYVDLKLFNDVNFVSMFWFQFGSGYCFTGWLIYLVPYALDVGITEYKAAALATFGGIGNLLGNVIYPLAAERFSVTHILYTSILVTFVALVLHPIFALLKTYIRLSISSAVFGCGRGIAALCSYEIVTGSVHEESRTNSIMWISVAYSVGAIPSGFRSGWIYDQLGSFAVSFFILSAVSLLLVVPQVLIDVKSKQEYSLVSSSDTLFE